MVANSSSYTVDGVGTEQGQCKYVNNQNYNFYPNNTLPTHYHHSLRTHENLSHSNPKNALQPSPGYPQPLAEKKPTCKEMLSTFIMETRGRFSKDKARLGSIETHCTNMSTTMKSLETHVG